MCVILALVLFSSCTGVHQPAERPSPRPGVVTSPSPSGTSVATSPSALTPVTFSCRLPVIHNGDHGYLSLQTSSFEDQGSVNVAFSAALKRWLPGPAALSPDGSEYAYLAVGQTSPPSNASHFVLWVLSVSGGKGRAIYSFDDRLAGVIGWGRLGVYVSHGTIPEQEITAVDPINSSERRIGPLGYDNGYQFQWWTTRNEFIWGSRTSAASQRGELVYMKAADGVVHHWFSPQGNEYPSYQAGYLPDGSPVVVDFHWAGGVVNIVAVPAEDRPHVLLSTLPSSLMSAVVDGTRLWLNVGDDLWLADQGAVHAVAYGFSAAGPCS